MSKKLCARCKKAPNRRYWRERTKPVTTTMLVRVNLSVCANSNGTYSWVFRTGHGVTMSTVAQFATRLEAWTAGREALKDFRQTTIEANNRLLAQVRPSE